MKKKIAFFTIQKNKTACGIQKQETYKIYHRKAIIPKKMKSHSINSRTNTISLLKNKKNKYPTYIYIKIFIN